ncbi:MAG TPA: heavy metal translocating P-type ATPase [Ignavibacteriaceae bacterium]|jgi:Cd2+/Zn2+-exporting ATPase|nr:MAG: Zinc-transporting ATPase [Ignavibacteria bacterium ADurb.Bin266]HQF43763.1 heavy metal translocating P-type ATPase [Ignavibacteriaceae bacterium]HQI42469.1 heavy metal translocating P-type ATPase [Ignavibacteriaceae bacterium]
MKKYKLNNIDCAACANNIENTLSKLPEVKFVSVNFATSTLHVDTDDIHKVKSKIKEIEPEVDVIEETANIISKNELFENRETLFKAGSAFILLIIGILLSDKFHSLDLEYIEYAVFISAYLISGWDVITGAIKNIIRGKVFDEQFLMTIATIGAFAIHQLPEAVAVMLFYVVGEFFQDIAVNRSRRSVKSLLEIRPDYANLKINDEIRKVSPEEVHPGQIIIVKPGEKIPLDGIVIEGNSFVDTSALTGESVPRSVGIDENVLAGMINRDSLLTINVTKEFGESSISKILEMVENSGSKKAETEKFITTFAKYYTPIVVFGAVLIAVLPPLLFPNQSFTEWIYRALVVLVISCPCALVISIPLGYFGGIGGASRKGILIKGSNYLDALTQVNTIVFDKTGTLTKGEFKVSEIFPYNGFSKSEVLKFAAHAEVNSNHPIAKSILETYKENIDHNEITEIKEILGYGISANISGKQVMIGNDKLLHLESIEHDICEVEGTVVHVTVNKVYAGYILISDSVKDDSVKAIKLLNDRNIATIMLTGDNKTAAEVNAKKLGIKEYYYELLPEDKVAHIEQIISKTPDGKTVFVGDGINDAPVLARADVGMAMGALGSDAAVETADIVLMSDSPMQVVYAIDIAKRTRKIVWQNISFALGVKSIFIVLGVFGIATMWEAVFGDVGVAIAAILNAMRVMNIDFSKE